MPKPIARLVVRGDPNEEDKGEDGSILGSRMSKFLKPGHVYELQEFDGAIILREVGKSHIPLATAGTGGCWYQDVNTILSIEGKYLFLTKDEYQELCKK